ncbi:MAG: carbohydrate-binding family 9-like protein [Synergistaceae bacterium]|jgi:hypothetical protein|nr:carbohydrate-binding family 9-like protein [Synergistaceae bacterium]
MKTYDTFVIESKETLDKCPIFHVDNVLWGSKTAPATTGRMGYIRGLGLFVRMTVNEPNPLRTMTEHMDMVCRDSAVEAFFAFPGDNDPYFNDDFRPDDNGLYFNFEINANGAMYAKTGRGRKGRSPLLPDEMEATGVTARLFTGGWEAEFLVPLSLLRRLVRVEDYEPGDVFFCNFYKISENPEIEHYLAFAPITTETPNFHLPRFFARSTVQDPKETADASPH